MPIRFRVVACTALLGGLLTMTGCSGDDASDGPQPTPSATARESVQSTLPSFESTCSDEIGDNVLQDADLKTVSMRNDGTLLHVVFELASPLSESDLPSSTFQIISYGLDGYGGYILGAKFMNGTSAIYAFDNESASQQNLDNGYVFADGTVSVRFPIADLQNYQDGISWYAALSVDGEDSDLCGEPMGTSNDVVF